MNACEWIKMTTEAKKVSNDLFNRAASWFWPGRFKQTDMQAVRLIDELSNELTSCRESLLITQRQLDSLRQEYARLRQQMPSTETIGALECSLVNMNRTLKTLGDFFRILDQGVKAHNEVTAE